MRRILSIVALVGVTAFAGASAAAANPTNGGRASVIPGTSIQALTDDIISITPAGAGALERGLTKKALLDELVKANPAVMDPYLKGKVDAADMRIVLLRAANNGATGTQLSTEKSAKTPGALPITSATALVTISARDGWSLKVRQEYQRNAVAVASAAGLAADQIRVIKPKKQETISMLVVKS